MSNIIEAWRDALKLESETKAALSERSKIVRELEGLLLEQMAMEGYDSVKHNGETIYKTSVRSVTKASGVSAEAVSEAIEGTDLGYLLKPTYNASSLKGAVLERLDAGEPLPSGLSDLIQITEYTKVGCRRS